MGNSIYWEPDVETMPRDKLETLQLERLKKTIIHAYENVSFYKKKFDEAGMDPYRFSRLEDVSRLPFTAKMTFETTILSGSLPVP